jgi:hypothetical protein
VHLLVPAVRLGREAPGAVAAGLSAIHLVENATAKKLLPQTIHHFASIPPLVIVARHHLCCHNSACPNRPFRPPHLVPFDCSAACCSPAAGPSLTLKPTSSRTPSSPSSSTSLCGACACNNPYAIAI